jgi:hypothetical protein
MLPLCGLRLLPPSGRCERRPAPPGVRQKPGSGPVYSLTLDGPIESRQQIGAFGTLLDASIAAPNTPERWTLDPLGPFPFYFFFLKSPDRTRVPAP